MKIIIKVFYTLVFYYIFKIPCVHYICSPSQFGSASSSHIWLHIRTTPENHTALSVPPSSPLPLHPKSQEKSQIHKNLFCSLFLYRVIHHTWVRWEGSYPLIKIYLIQKFPKFHHIDLFHVINKYTRAAGEASHSHLTQCALWVLAI